MVFWEKRVYADAAAGTPISKESKKELERLLELYGNPSALHREALEAKKELERARKTIADSIGAHADEIIFVGSGTEGNNLAITGAIRPLLQSVGLTKSNRRSVHAVTSAIEHQSVLEPLRALKKEGLKLTELPVDTEGLVSPKALAKAITKKTALVSIQLVNSEIGTIEPIKALVKEARRARLLFHTDASQTPLWLPINVEKLGVDLLTLDGQKVQGPKGVGALYVRRGTSLEPMMRGGKQEQGLRGGTENVPLIGAFAVALREAQERVGERAKRVAAVRDYLWGEIKRLVPDAVLNGPAGQSPLGGARVANNLNISIPGLDAEMTVIALDSEGIAVSTRSACTTGEEEPSQVIQALGVPRERAKTAIRITLLPDATERDARRIARALAKVAKRYRT